MVMIPDRISQLLHFLDETPLQVVVMAIEETTHLEALPPAHIWLVRQVGSVLRDLWL
jgi:hypothetical protein